MTGRKGEGMRNYCNLHTRSSLGTCSRSSVTSPTGQTLFFRTRPFLWSLNLMSPCPSPLAFLPSLLLPNCLASSTQVSHLLNASRIQRNKNRAQGVLGMIRE